VDAPNHDGPNRWAVDVRNLTVTYSSGNALPIRALDGVSLQLLAGETLGILGESGSGKSTLAAALLRSLPSPATRTSGSIFIGSHDLLQLSESNLRSLRGREISLIPQDPALALNPVLTVGSQIAEVLRAHLPLPRHQRRERALQLLREVGFDQAEEIYSAYPHQLSGGQRQRAAIAQAVACHPSVLIADEPTSKLDATLQAEIVELLQRIRQQHRTTIVLITHDPSLLAGFADRIAVMYAGRIIEVGSSAQVFSHPLHPYTQALVRIAASSVLRDSALRVRLAAIEGDPPDPTTFPPGCRFEPRCSERMEICSRRYPASFSPEPSRPVNCFKYGE
jgi:oligopeptide/dipeptide ABC transporter ATP-binding protein